MKVCIKKFNVYMELKNSGIEFEVRDNDDTFLGDFVINKTGLIWCKGKTSSKNGIKKNWAEVISLFEGNASTVNDKQ